MDINLYCACISVFLSVFVFAWGHLVVHGHPDVCVGMDSEVWK